jgi:hypothetical protein
MTDQEFQAIYPVVFGWVQQTLRQYASAARPINSFDFRRLPDFYDADTLAQAKVVAVDKVPVPPLSAMGLGRFADFEGMDAAGITYLDTYFLRADQAWDESLHFHELSTSSSGASSARRGSSPPTRMGWSASGIGGVRWK